MAQDGIAILSATPMLTPAAAAAPPLEASMPIPAAKRVLDLAVASLLLVITAPLLVAAALAVLVANRQHPLFADDRIGAGGRLFRCRKLQTMRDRPGVLDAYLAANPEERESYALTRKLRDDPRITSVGRLLRKTSVDELPQLLNVLRGDMSIVGPRPLSPAEFMRRGESRFVLMQVRPGLTGLWQTRGRSDLSHRRRVALDTFYVRHWSLRLDLMVLAATPLAVLSRRGAR